MIRIFSLCLLFTFFGQLQSQDICGQNRYLSEIFTNVNITTGIQFGNANPYGIINSQNLFLDIYEGQGDTLQKRPVVIHAFGGGFLIGFRSEPDIPNWGRQYARRGYAFISIDYRLGFNPLDQNSAVRAAYRAAQDYMAALRYLKDNAVTLRLDMDNVFVTGSSAGCFAALILAFMEESDRPSSTFGTFLEPSDLGCFNCSGNNNNNNQLVPMHAVINNWGAILDTAFIDLAANPADNVPVISFHGTNDLIVPYGVGSPFSLPVFPPVYGSQPLHNRLNNQGIYNQLFPLNGLGHEPELLNPWVTDTIVREASRFLYEIMKPNTSNIQGSNSVCVGDTLSYSVNFTNGSQYCWEVVGGTIINQNNNTVEILWTNLGQASVSLTEYNYIHAKNTKTLNVTTDVPPNSNFSFTSQAGLFNFVNIENPSMSYSWNFDDGSSSNIQNAQYQYTDTGSYIVSLTVNTGICSKTTTQTIESDICPLASFTTSLNNGNLEINNSAQFYNTIFWDFGNGTTSTENLPTPVYSVNGNYTITQIVTNNFCSDTLLLSVDVIACPTADFDFTANGLNVQFTNTSTNSVLVFWNINGVNYSSSNPTVTFPSAGNYTVVLTVYNQNSCIGEITRAIAVTEAEIINSIKPNNERYLNIYPIPASNYIFIESNENRPIESIKIIDLNGKLVLDYYSNSKEIDISNISKGIYILRIKIEDEIYFKKIIKN